MMYVFIILFFQKNLENEIINCRIDILKNINLVWNPTKKLVLHNKYNIFVLFYSFTEQLELFHVHKIFSI